MVKVTVHLLELAVQVNEKHIAFVGRAVEVSKKYVVVEFEENV
jgi:hypothetical protein